MHALDVGCVGPAAQKKLLAQRTSFCIVSLLLKLNMEPKADIALIGLAVMGQNLILNMDDHGYTVVAFNRTVAKVDEFVAKEAKGTRRFFLIPVSGFSTFSRA